MVIKIYKNSFMVFVHAYVKRGGCGESPKNILQNKEKNFPQRILENDEIIFLVGSFSVFENHRKIKERRS